MTSNPKASSKPCVAIAGATGKLGQHITNAFLEPAVLSRCSSVLLLSRQPLEENPKLEKWSKEGAKVFVYDEEHLSDSFRGVDVLVNAIGSKGHAFKDKLLEVLPDSSVKLYLPSEFGVDHTIHDFKHPEWDAKKHHFSLAQEILSHKKGAGATTSEDTPPLKICRVYIGLFLEHSIGPWFGFDTKNRAYEAIGSSDAKVSYTSMADVGRAVAALATLPPEQVPESIHLSGTEASMAEVAEIMANAQGENRTIAVSVVDGPAYKQKTLEGVTRDPAKCLRFLMGDGSIDHRPKAQGGLGNDNELVNPGQSRWKWKTMAEYAAEVKGHPWKDY